MYWPESGNSMRWTCRKTQNMWMSLSCHVEWSCCRSSIDKRVHIISLYSHTYTLLYKLLFFINVVLIWNTDLPLKDPQGTEDDNGCWKENVDNEVSCNHRLFGVAGSLLDNVVVNGLHAQTVNKLYLSNYFITYSSYNIIMWILWWILYHYMMDINHLKSQ